MAFDTIHGGLGKSGKWKTEIEMFSILYKNKKFYHKKSY